MPTTKATGRPYRTLALALLDAVHSGQATDLRSAAKRVGVALRQAVVAINTLDDDDLRTWHTALRDGLHGNESSSPTKRNDPWAVTNRLIDAAERGAPTLADAARAARVALPRARIALEHTTQRDPGLRTLWETALGRAKHLDMTRQAPAKVVLQPDELPDIVWIPGDPGYAARAAVARDARRAEEWRGREPRRGDASWVLHDAYADAREIAWEMAGGGRMPNTGNFERGPEGGRRSLSDAQAWSAAHGDLPEEDEDGE